MLHLTNVQFFHQIAALLTLPFDVVKTHKQTEMWESETIPGKHLLFY